MRLWIGVHLPYLSLETYRPTWSSDAGGLVILERERVLTMSRAARLAGVRPGMRRGGVLTLSPYATLRERDAQRENACLFAAGVALMRFSPLVTLAAEATVLLEVSGSLRLFGGVRSLRRQVRDTLTALAMTGYVASHLPAPGRGF